MYKKFINQRNLFKKLKMDCNNGHVTQDRSFDLRLVITFLSNKCSY